MTDLFSLHPAYAFVGALSASGVAIVALAVFLNAAGDQDVKFVTELIPTVTTPSTVFVREFTSSAQVTGTLVYEAEGGDLTITTQGLPPLSPDEIYQIWVVRDDVPRPLGFLETIDEERAFVDLKDIDLTGDDIVTITVEPAGGSDQPTTLPILETQL